MEPYQNQIVRLIPYRQSRFPELLFPGFETPLYFASVPKKIDPDRAVVFILRANEFEGFLSFETRTFLQEMKGYVIEALVDEKQPVIIFGQESELKLLMIEFQRPVPQAVPYFFIGQDYARKRPSQDYFVFLNGDDSDYCPIYDQIALQN